MLVHPLGPDVILTRDFYYKNSIYYLGQHLAGDYIKKAPAPTRGAPVIAPETGRAMASPLYDYYRGWFIKVECPDGWLIGIAHLRDYAIPAGVWVPVKQGDLLGHADNTGLSSGDHAHIDCWNIAKKSSEAVQKMGYWAHDPEKWIVKIAPPEEDDMPYTEAELLAIVQNGQAGNTPLLVARPGEGPIEMRLEPPLSRADHWISIMSSDGTAKVQFLNAAGQHFPDLARTITFQSGVKELEVVGLSWNTPDVVGIRLEKIGGGRPVTATGYWRESRAKM